MPITGGTWMGAFNKSPLERLGKFQKKHGKFPGGIVSGYFKRFLE